MRKAILDENKRVIGFEPMEEEMSEQAKAQRQKQVDYIAKKYGFDKGTKQSPTNQKKGENTMKKIIKLLDKIGVIDFLDKIYIANWERKHNK